MPGTETTTQTAESTSQQETSQTSQSTETTGTESQQEASQASQQTSQESTQSSQSGPAIGPKGELGENWFLALGDEFAGMAKDLGKHKNIGSLVKELEYMRKNGIEYPGEDADEKAVERFRKVAGVPESPEGYGLTAEAMKLPEGLQFDAEMASAISAAAHKHHAPPAVVASIAATFNEVMGKRVAEAQKQAEESRIKARDELAKEWGRNYEVNGSMVRHLTAQLAERAGIPYDSEDIPRLASDPTFAKIMMAAKGRINNDEDRTPSGDGVGTLKSPAEKIADIKAGRDPVWSPLYKSRSEADRAKVGQHILGLMEQASK